MPAFYDRMKDSLRSDEEGADTIIWLCSCPNADLNAENGLFYFDRAVVPCVLAIFGAPATFPQHPILLSFAAQHHELLVHACVSQVVKLEGVLMIV